MRKLFIDTWGWLTLRDSRESQHQQADIFYRQFRNQGGVIITTDYVLDETFTLLFKRLSLPKALDSLATIEAAVSSGYLQLEWISTGRFMEAIVLRRKFQDKPQISFTDLTSMVVMQQLAVDLILTGDAHFGQVGLNIQIVP